MPRPTIEQLEASVPDWPAPTRVDDRRSANSLREGDAADVAHVYSSYAAPLFDYCHALLRDQDDAVAALHDTFVAAHAHIDRLTELEYFRAWLYALARNEALNRLNDPDRHAERAEAPEVENAFQGAEERVSRMEGRALMHSALSALTGRQRETIDLSLRHGLEPQDLAGVFGISGEEAVELAAEAQKRLGEALAAAVIARTGAEHCPSVSALMDHGGWPLTPALSSKLIRHIQNCPTCSERDQRKVSAARLIETLPVAMLPSELQRRVLTTLTSPDMAEERARIAAGAEPLDTWGWPTPVAGSGTETERSRSRAGMAVVWPLAAVATLVAVLAGTMLLWLPASSDGGSAKAGPSQAAPLDSEDPEASPSDDVSSSPEVSETPEETETPTPTPTPTRPRTPTPTPSPSRTPSRPPTPKPVPGTLVVSSGGCAGISFLSGESASCTMTVQAVGGKVTWSASGSGAVSASGSGTLNKGESGTVTVTVSGSCTSDTDGSGSVSFSPNGSGSVSWTCKAPQAGPGDPPPPSVSQPQPGLV